HRPRLRLRLVHRPGGRASGILRLGLRRPDGLRGARPWAECGHDLRPYRPLGTQRLRPRVARPARPRHRRRGGARERRLNSESAAAGAGQGGTMTEGNPTVGWIGIGRMGLPMAERLLDAGHALAVWNRTRAKAEPLAARGATLCARPADLAAVDVLFTMVATGRDLQEVLFGQNGVTSEGRAPRIVVDCSGIGSDEGERIRARLAGLGAAMIAAPVSGNAKCVRAGKLSAVCSGPEAAFCEAKPLIAAFAPRGVAYVGKGELARFCKIAHNVLLGVTIQNLAEITVLAQKAGVPRHAFLAFVNDSVMGSIFSRYKSNALVNLDWTTTFTPTLLRKDL